MGSGTDRSAERGETTPSERHDQRGDAAKDDRPRGADQLAECAGLEPTELVGGADKHVLDREDPTGDIAGGVAKGTRVERMKTLTASAADRANMATKASAYERARPRTIIRSFQQATASATRGPTRRSIGPERDKQRCRPRTQAHRGPQPAKADRPDVKAHRYRRQERHRAAEEHGKEVERDGTKKDRRRANEPQTFECLVETASRSGNALLEHVANLVVADGAELAGA